MYQGPPEQQPYNPQPYSPQPYDPRPQYQQPPVPQSPYPQQPYPPRPPYDTYGSKINEYKYLGYIGVLMVLLGPGFLLPMFGPYGFVAGISLLFIGAMCAISGLTGYLDEKKKLGLPRIHTALGYVGAVFGVISVLSGSTPLIPIPFGIIGIIIGRIAYKKGDLEYGEVGMYCGATGIVVSIIIMFVFWFPF